MIKVFCSTPSGMGRYEEWPTHLTAVPRKGDYVESKNGNRLVVKDVIFKYPWSDNGVDQTSIELILGY